MFTLGVSTILFYGGLNLSLEILRKVWLSLGLLAVLGVIVTAVITGAAAALVFGLPFEQGLLIGAVLSPTDPAILIPLFIGSRLRAKVAQTVVAESAFNDPTGAVLALAIAGALLSGKNSLTGPAGDFLGQLALSTAGGVLAGIVLSAAISSRRTGIWRESSAIAVLAVVAMSYVSLDFAGGSGYLGAFLAGLIVGNMKMLGLSMHDEHSRDLIITTRSLADIVTIFVFVLVGANLPFHALGAGDPPGPRGGRRAAARRAPDHGRDLHACPTGAAAGAAPSSPSCAGRARPASCPPRWSACSPRWRCPTATCSRASSRSRSSSRWPCRPFRPRGWRAGSGCSKWTEPT